MCYQLLTSNGGTEAVIDDNCGVSKFYAIANTLANDLQVKFINQIDDSDTLDWDFRFHDQFLTLHYNVFNGVSIYPQRSANLTKQRSAVLEVARFLERKVF